MTDLRRGVMRIISPEKVWRLCEFEEGTAPRLRTHNDVFTEIGLAQVDWEAAAARFDVAAARDL